MLPAVCSHFGVTLLLLLHHRTTAVEQTADADLLYVCTDGGSYSARNVYLVVHQRRAPCQCQVTSTSNLNVSWRLSQGCALNISSDPILPLDTPNDWNTWTNGSQPLDIGVAVLNLTITVNNTCSETQTSFRIFSFQGGNDSVTVKCTSVETEHTTQDGIPSTVAATSYSTISPLTSDTSPNGTDSTTPVPSNHSPSDTSTTTKESTTTATSTTAPAGQTDNYIVLGVGIVLLVAAAVVLVFIVRIARRQGKPERIDSKGRHEKGRPKGRNKQRQAALGSSNASLISNHHNYEEVSEDGLSGSDVKSLHDRKASGVVPPPAAHIVGAGHKPEQRSRHQSEARSAKGEGACPGSDAEVDGDYNVLDLGKSARLAKAQQDSSPAPAARANEDDGVYMEVGNDDGIYDNLADDAKKRRQDQASASEVRATCSPGHRDCSQEERAAEVVFLGDSAARQHARQEQSAPVRRTRYSKSYEDLVVDAKPGKETPAGHKYSRSLDLDKDNRVNYENHIISGSRGHPRPASHKRRTASSHHLADPPASDKPRASTDELYANHTPRNATGPAQLSGHTRKASSPEIVVERVAAAQTKPEDVELRNKPRRPNIKSAVVTSVPHPKGVTASFLQFQEAVRHSMEINPDELVMMDNVLYGTLPRNKSLPTTEL